MKALSLTGVAAIAAIVSFTMAARAHKPEGAGRWRRALTFLRTLYVAYATLALALALPLQCQVRRCGQGASAAG